MRLLGNAILACGCTWLLASCVTVDRAPEPGTTAGYVHVGSPRVSGRERLVNDRREQEEWLQRQLATVDQAQFTVGGAIDTRSFSAVAAGLLAKTGPDVDLARTQQTTALALAREQGASVLAAERVRSTAVNQIASQLAKKEIDAKEAAAQLSALGISTTPLNTSAAASAPSVSASGAGSGATGGTTAFLDLFKAAAGGGFTPGSGASGAVTTITGSPIDLFRDRLALREEIRNEINENALDETHDLISHTLYRLTFDATLVPDDDTSAWAKVHVVLKPPLALDASIWHDYRAYKERALNTLILQRVQKFQQNSEGCGDKKTVLTSFVECVADKAFASNLSRRLVRAASERPAIEAPWYLMGRNTGPIPRSFLEAANSFRAASVIPVPTPNKVTRPQPSASPASAAASAAEAASAARLAWFSRVIPLPAQASPPQTETEQAAGALFGVIASATASEFTDEGLGCFYKVASSNGASPPFTSNQQARAFVLRLREPSPEELPDGCNNDLSPEYEFMRKVANLPTQPRVYAVTPKESVQRISDVSSRRSASEFVLGLSALAGAGQFEAMASTVQQNDAFLQALRRQPLVVGYTGPGATVKPAAAASAPASAASAPYGAGSDDLSFGWVLGPTFAISKDGSRASFRHTVRQQSVTASVSVPSWWRSVDVEITGSWLRENKHLRKRWNKDGSERVVNTQTYNVALPFRASSLDGVFAYGAEERLPYVEDLYNAAIQVGTGARLLVRGGNIWRSTEVFIGAQRADRVRLLPDMKGIVAEFDEIKPVWGADLRRIGADTVDISVATADGFTKIGQASITKGSATATALVGIGRRFFGDKAVVLRADPPIRSFRVIELRAKSRINASLDAKLGDTGSGIVAVSRDGSAVNVILKTDDLKDFKLRSGDPIDLALVTYADGAVGPVVTPVVQNATYYAKTSDAQAVLSWEPATGSGMRAIRLKLPPAVQQAFQAAATGTVRLVATLTTPAGDSGKADPLTCKVDGKDCVEKLKFTNPSKEVTAAIQSGDFKLEFKFDDDDAPELNTTTLSGKP